MQFMLDKKRKILFGWSAKCGCTHIKKIIWYLFTDNEDYLLHTNDDRSFLPNDIEEYTTILIVRNPYERFVSGFLDKYKPDGHSIKLWKHEQLTFTVFVNEFIKADYKMFDRHHFTPQTTEEFNHDKIIRSKKLILYDIKNIDYKYIESLYDKKISERLLNFRGNHHEKRKIKPILETPVYDLEMASYLDYSVPIQFFYNKDLKNKLFNYFFKDFLFFKENGINYDIICS